MFFMKKLCPDFGMTSSVFQKQAKGGLKKPSQKYMWQCLKISENTTKEFRNTGLYDSSFICLGSSTILIWTPTELW